MEKVKTSRNLKTRVMTTREVMDRRIPAPTSANISHGHLIYGMRDINHIEWELWEQQVSEYMRTVEKGRLDRNNRYYNAMERIQALLGDVRRRSEELQVAYEEMQATNEELQSTNEELQSTTDELERTSAYRQTLTDSMLDVLMTTDTGGVITEVNRATELISGYTAEELVGKSLSDFFTEPERAEAGIKQVMAEKEISNYELTLVTKAGDEVPVSYNATVLEDPEGRITTVLGSARDMTQINQLITDLQVANEEMQATNEELQSTNEELQSTTEELERTSAYRQTLMDSMLDILMTTDTEGAITEVNRATELISGYTAEELVGKPLSDFFTEPERAEAGIKQVLTGKKVTDYDLTLVSKDGREVPLSYNAAVLEDSEGRVTGVLGSARDVTEQRQAEEALNRLAAIVEYSDDAIIGKTLNGVILSWNKGAERMYGYTEEEVVGENISILALPGHLDELSELLKKIGAGESVEHFETTRVRKDGKQIHVSLTLSPIMDASGNIIGVSTISHNITERKQAEEALQMASAYNRSLIEANLDPLVVIGPEGKITDVNAATEAVTGYTREELIGTDFSEYFAEPESALAGYKRAFETGKVQDYELEIRHRDGSVTPVLYNAAVYRDESGEVKGVFAAARDIAKQKQADTILKQTLARLESSNKELEQFAYVASHDLQEPLRMVASYTQLLEKRYKGKLDSDADEFIAFAVDGVTRMQALINSLLMYSRVTTKGKGFDDSNFETIFDHVLANLHTTIEDSNAVITHDPLPIENK